MAEIDKPGHADMVMVEVPAQLIAALYQAVDHATGRAHAGVEVESPAQAVALLHQAAGLSDRLDLQDAAHDQQALNQISAAVVSKAIALIMAIGDQGHMTSLVAAGPVVPEDLAVLMGNLFEATKPSTGAEFADAVSQQQQNTDAQETTTEGLLEIYSLDTTAAAGATKPVAQTGAAARPQRLHDDTD
ncbi:RebB family R body protein [Inquilinus sp.]|uniref:RebB family R body protein n=1 Tax=Inquilinus sp. TaxID=1932117 RepID=UPI0031E00A9F